MTGSVTGILGSKDLLDYSMTKGGIHAFTRSLADHLVDRGHPRQLRSRPARSGRRSIRPTSTASEVAKFGAKTPMKRPAQPEEIAPAFVFLASPQMLQLHHRRGPADHRRLLDAMARLSETLDRLPLIDGDSGDVNVVVETPKGSRNKYKYDTERGADAARRPTLGEGLAFPFDFGFLPSTRGEDGDPLDVLLLLDEAVPAGCVATARPVRRARGRAKGEAQALEAQRPFLRCRDARP